MNPRCHAPYTGAATNPALHHEWERGAQWDTLPDVAYPSLSSLLTSLAGTGDGEGPPPPTHDTQDDTDYRALMGPGTSPYYGGTGGALDTPSPVGSDANDFFHMQCAVLRGEHELHHLLGSEPDDPTNTMLRHLREVPSAADAHAALPQYQFTRDALHPGAVEARALLSMPVEPPA